MTRETCYGPFLLAFSDTDHHTQPTEVPCGQPEWRELCVQSPMAPEQSFSPPVRAAARVHGSQSTEAPPAFITSLSL